MSKKNTKEVVDCLCNKNYIEDHVKNMKPKESQNHFCQRCGCFEFEIFAQSDTTPSDVRFFYKCKQCGNTYKQ